MLRIGISASFSHRDPTRPLFKDKTLLCLEESLGHWVQTEGALPFLIPTIAQGTPLNTTHWVEALDGLLLQGGADVNPGHYGEEPLRPEWIGDAIRDAYELDLIDAFSKAGKPVLGVCRGLQLLNVYCGGSLYQDIALQHPEARVHRDWEVYDHLNHEIEIEKDSVLSRLYGGLTRASVSSIHHQGIRILGKGLVAEARSVDDGIIEAFRRKTGSYLAAVQWHPEFHPGKPITLMDGTPLLRDFLAAARK